jgi:hypothetical protein
MILSSKAWHNSIAEGEPLDDVVAEAAFLVVLQPVPFCVDGT